MRCEAGWGVDSPQRHKGHEGRKEEERDEGERRRIPASLHLFVPSSFHFVILLILLILSILSILLNDGHPSIMLPLLNIASKIRNMPEHIDVQRLPANLRRYPRFSCPSWATLPTPAGHVRPLQSSR